MRISFLYIILFISAALRVNAADLLLEVRDSKSKELLQGCVVNVQVANQPAFSKNCVDGLVILNNVSFPITFTAKMLGYEPQVGKIELKDIKSNEQTPRYTIFLASASHHIHEVVITGQATPVLASQSIYKVNTISSSQIAQRGAVNLADVLNFELNNFVNNDNVLGSSLSIGGISGQNVKILLNGIPLTGRENGNIDLGQLNMNNIKRIEMIQGPMSVIYGSNAMGGVINLITNTSKNKHSFSIRNYTESIGRYNVMANASFSKGKHSINASVARNFFGGWSSEDSIDRFQIWKPKTQYTADFQYDVDVSNKLKLNYFGSYLNEKITNKGQPIVNPYEGYAFDEYYRTHRIINALNGTYSLSKSSSFTFNNSYTNYTRTKNRFKKDLVSLDQFETKSRGDQDTSIFKTLNLRGVFTSSGIKHLELLGGYELMHETGQSFKLADEQKKMTDLGIFASANFSYKSLSIQPSLRMTVNSLYSNGYTPALHLKYSLTENTQIRASYANGYRVPTLKELYLQFIDQNHTIIGNPELKPEQGDHIEVGLDKPIVSNQKSNLTFCGTLAHNDIRNMITLAVYNSQGILRIYENLERYKNWMSNAKFVYRSEKLNAQLGGGYIFVEASRIMPQHTIAEMNMALSYKISSLKSTFNINYKYNSKQPVITVDEQFLYTDPIHIANMSIQRKFIKESLSLQVGVKNLLNLQTSALNGAINSQGSAHTSASGMQIFPARSLFLDVSYQF